MINYPVHEVRTVDATGEVNFDGMTCLDVIKELQKYVEEFGETVFFDYYYDYNGSTASLKVKETESDESFAQRVAEYEQERAEAKEKALRAQSKAKEVAAKAAKEKEDQERKLLKDLKEKYGE